MTKAVTDLNVQCSLQVRNLEAQGVAMSDCCQAPATTAVEMADGRRMFRCEEHKGVLRREEHKSNRRQELGDVWETVLVREEDR